MTHLFIHLPNVGVHFPQPQLPKPGSNTHLKKTTLLGCSCPPQETAPSADHLNRVDEDGCFCFPNPSGTEKAQEAKGAQTHCISVDSTSKENQDV